MPFTRPTLPELVDRIQNDLVTRVPFAGPVLRRSIVAVIARVLAGAVHLLHGHLAFLADQLFPDTSETSYLERQTALFGLTRIAASYAAGNIVATGTTGVVIPAGTVLQRADGSTYTTQADVAIAGGTATLAVVADIAGLAGNVDPATAMTFVSPITSVNPAAAVDGSGLSGGADAETDDALRARLLLRLQTPPQGGSNADYIAWALTVAGVTRVWVYPQELADGQVTVRFVRDNDGSGAAIIPDAGEVAAVQAAINAVRPVTATVTVVAPVSDALNFSLHIVPDTVAIRAAITAELTDLLARAATPGGTVLLSQIRTAIGNADGLTDYTLTTPNADSTHATGHIATLGTVSFT